MRNVVLFRIGSQLEIVSPPPVGMVGQPYSFTFQAVGGSGSYTWVCTSPLGSSGITASGPALSSASVEAGGDFAGRVTVYDNADPSLSVYMDFVLHVIGNRAGMRLISGDPMYLQTYQRLYTI